MLTREHLDSMRRQLARRSDDKKSQASCFSISSEKSTLSLMLLGKNEGITRLERTLNEITESEETPDDSDNEQSYSCSQATSLVRHPNSMPYERRQRK